MSWHRKPPAPVYDPTATTVCACGKSCKGDTKLLAHARACEAWRWDKGLRLRVLHALDDRNVCDSAIRSEPDRIPQGAPLEDYQGTT